MLKRILVPIDNSAYSNAAEEYAIMLAKNHQAFITSMAVVDKPGITQASKPMGIGHSHRAGEARRWLTENAETEAFEALTHFSSRCAEEGIPYVDIEENAGPSQAIIKESNYYDLTIMGVNSCIPYREECGYATVIQVLENGARPMLVIPREFRSIQHILFCYDGSIQAARAMQMFCLLAPFQARTMTVLNVNDDQQEGALLTDRAAVYLKAYGYQINPKSIRGNPKKEIIKFARDRDVDLVVMGPFSASKIARFFLGSVSKAFLEDGTFPLFLYH